MRAHGMLGTADMALRLYVDFAQAFCDMEFRVCSPQLMQLPAQDGQSSHTGGAEIRKLRSDGVEGWLQEAFSDADNFGVCHCRLESKVARWTRRWLTLSIC